MPDVMVIGHREKNTCKICDKMYVFLIYKEFLQVREKKMSNWIGKWAKEM